MKLLHEQIYWLRGLHLHRYILAGPRLLLGHGSSGHNLRQSVSKSILCGLRIGNEQFLHNLKAVEVELKNTTRKACQRSNT